MPMEQPIWAARGTGQLELHQLPRLNQTTPSCQEHQNVPRVVSTLPSGPNDLCIVTDAASSPTLSLKLAPLPLLNWLDGSVQPKENNPASEERPWTDSGTQRNLAECQTTLLPPCHPPNLTPFTVIFSCPSIAVELLRQRGGNDDAMTHRMNAKAL